MSAEASSAVGPLEPIVGPAGVAGSFDLSERAEALLASRPDRVNWVEIEPEPNVAIGSTPFGPFFDGGATATVVVPLNDRGKANDFTPESDVLTVVVGRELHRDDGALAAAKAIAATGSTLIVDMGFANSDAVDIATYGASRLVGQALIDLVEGRA